MVIITNTAAQRSARVLGESSARLAKSLTRLSSGSKIVSPEDDAAGLAVSMRFDAQVNRIAASGRNVSNAIAFSQTQDAFLQKVSKVLQRMSELSILAQDVTKSDADRGLYDAEFSALEGYIVDVSGKTFNGVSLFSNGGLSVTKDEDGAGFTMTQVDLGVGAYTAITGGSSGVSTASAAASALTALGAAITQLATDRANVGANIARLSYTKGQLAVLRDNLAAANSRIKDLEVAEESTQFARYTILVESGSAMLAQANASPEAALQLLL